MVMASLLAAASLAALSSARRCKKTTTAIRQQMRMAAANTPPMIGPVESPPSPPLPVSPLPVSPLALRALSLGSGVSGVLPADGVEEESSVACSPGPVLRGCPRAVGVASCGFREGRGLPVKLCSPGCPVCEPCPALALVVLPLLMLAGHGCGVAVATDVEAQRSFAHTSLHACAAVVGRQHVSLQMSMVPMMQRPGVSSWSTTSRNVTPLPQYK